MKRTIGVALGNSGRRVGVLHYTKDGEGESTFFEYAAEWLDANDRFAIDPGLALVAGPQFRQRSKTGSVFHGAIAESEPGGWTANLIRRYNARPCFAAKVRSPTSGALEFLLDVDDFSRVGALRFCDEAGVFQRQPEPGGRSAPSLFELSEMYSSILAVETNTETQTDLSYLRRCGVSLQGVRPKCTVLDDDGRILIAKFPRMHDDRAVTKGEILALRLADDAGITAAQGRIITFDGIPAALIRRFDRVNGERLMYLSAAALMQTSRDDPGPRTYTKMVDAIRIHGATPQADIEELWRRIAFFILITNVDDHLHHHGFLRSERESWRLAPAFDVNAIPGKPRELKTWLSKETGPAATVEALMSAVPYFGLKLDRARLVLGEVEAAVAKWRDRGADLGMTTVELDQFAGAFEHEERIAAKFECTR